MVELGEVGYERLSIERVAKRAGTAKTTIYRRWRDKDALIVEAVREELGAIAASTAADAGNLRADLVAHVRAWIANFGPDRISALAGLLLAMRTNGGLATIVREELVHSDVLAMGRIIERAVARGEIPDRRRSDLVLRIPTAVVLQQLLLLTGRADTKFVNGLVDEVLLPMLRSGGDPEEPAAVKPRGRRRRSAA